MGQTQFHVAKLTDRELLAAFKAVAKDCAIPDTAQFSVTPVAGLNAMTNSPISTVEQNGELQTILREESALAHSYSLQCPLAGGGEVTFRVTRQGFTDEATVAWQDYPQPSSVPLVKLLGSARKHLRAFERTEALDKFLGPELTEFNGKREEAVRRMEAVTQQLIIQNEEYRRRVDEESAALKAKVQAEGDQLKEKLAAEHREQETKLQKREAELAERIKELDDRSSRHARRDARKELKTMLADRGEKFALTRRTEKKRLPIHGLFILLILATAAYAVMALTAHTQPADGAAFWLMAARSVTGVLAFAAAVIFYIRWNDQWFRQHSDEEFRLKRLELDIDRASWVVELAMEWKDEKGSELPAGLLARLTENLFGGTAADEAVRHPSEDLASALLGASSALSLKIPGVGEATLNRQGIKDFKKNVEEAKDGKNGG